MELKVSRSGRAPWTVGSDAALVTRQERGSC